MKKTMQFIAIVLSLFLFLPAASAVTDLSENHMFYEEINYLIDKGVVKGYSDGTIRPDRSLNRAEAAVMIGRLKGLDGTPQKTPFRDVPAGHYASGYIANAAEAGYVLGHSDGTYRPDVAITRNDMALVAERVFDLNYFYFYGIKDSPDDLPDFQAVSKVFAASIAIGYPDGTFRPLQEGTRGQFSAFLARALEPKFKNKASIAHSYQRDKTKTYTYRMENDNVGVARFVKVPALEGQEDEFVWETRVGEERYHELEYENTEGFAVGSTYSEYSSYLTYPVQDDKLFLAGYNPAVVLYTITGVDKSVKTEYQTFIDAVEVTTDDGGVYYMVEGFSVVKWIKSDGTVSKELMDVE
ncbi:S-layer homology domain-containing protein [Planococcus soli]|uniref:S-layer homology domain-containing protein n=1 Tax=Planococcus soli TaxID=2666072 RepID=UPI00115E3043|nr:S-layer homology domain-containing protein [Planococcus soli]